ncbi:hypothetical protein ACFLU4_05340 [Chloroflexota bacterium]
MLLGKKRAIVAPERLSTENRVGAERLSGPKEIPDIVRRYIVTMLDGNPDIVWNLNSVLRNSGIKHICDVRIFDPFDAKKERVNVKNFISLDGHPELILYHGWFDEKNRVVKMEQDIEYFSTAGMRMSGLL